LVSGKETGNLSWITTFENLLEFGTHEQRLPRSDGGIAKGSSSTGGWWHNRRSSRKSCNKNSGRDSRRSRSNRRRTGFGFLQATLGGVVDNPLASIDKSEAARTFGMICAPV
jgi:hypothetical protein